MYSKLPYMFIKDLDLSKKKSAFTQFKLFLYSLKHNRLFDINLPKSKWNSRIRGMNAHSALKTNVKEKYLALFPSAFTHEYSANFHRFQFVQLVWKCIISPLKILSKNLYFCAHFQVQCGMFPRRKIET